MTNDEKRNWLLLGLILVVGVLLRFWGLDQFGIQHDLAINSVRAFGWLDFLVGDGQTSPIVWFGQTPWWGFLSFHDHPPLVFLIQFIFFAIFGGSDFVTLLPFALASLGVLAIVYKLFIRFGTRQQAIVAIAFLSISNYAVWASRTGYLEGVQIFFIVAALFLAVAYQVTQKSKYVLGWGVVVGLALLSKYTAIFLIPSFLVGIFIWQRKLFKRPSFWLSITLLIVTLTPIIIYNTALFQTRGHFDAALSSMVGLHPEDYAIISQRGVNTNIAGNIKNIVLAVYKTSSIPLLVMYVLAIGYSLWRAWRRSLDNISKIVLVHICFLLLMFLFSGAGVRFLSILIPFLIILVTTAAVDIYQKISRPRFQKMLVLVMAGVIVLEFGYTINTNIINQPLGPPGVTYSSERFYDKGWPALHAYIRQEVFPQLPDRQKITTLQQLATGESVKGKDVLLVDERVDWFSRTWYLDRYERYYDLPIMTFSDINITVEAGTQKSVFEILTDFEASQYILVVSVGQNEDIFEDKQYAQLVDGFVNILEEQDIQPQASIQNYLGDTVFTIYHFSLN